MSIIEKVKSLFDGAGSSYTSSALAFERIDIEKTKRKLKLVKEGARRGTDELPRSDAEELDDIEQKVAAFIQQEAANASETIHDHLESFKYRLKDARSQNNANKMEQIAAQTEANLKAKSLSNKALLFTTHESVSNIKDKFDRFKSKYDLFGEASYPSSRFLNYSVIALIVVLETGLNGTFLGKADEGGIVGGIAFAFAFALINAVLAYFLGNHVLRYVNYRSSVIKAICVVGSLSLAGLMFATNLILAWIRTQATGFAENNQTITSALQDIRLNELLPALANVESMILFAVGMACCTILTFDFWNMDDPFPGFGKISREYKSKIDHYADLKSDVIDELHEIQKEAYAELEQIHNEVSSLSEQADTIIEAEDRWRRLHVAHLDHLEDAGRQLIGTYRVSNMSARKTEEPGYFKENWSLKRYADNAADGHFLAIAKSIQTELKSLGKSQTACVKRITAAYDEALAEYKTIEQL